MVGRYDYTGIIHFHSEYSHDGRVSVGEIIKVAQEQKIDFLMLTDHSSLEARRRGMEGWHGSVFLVVGQEIAPRFNHYIAFGGNEEILAEEEAILSPQKYIDAVTKGGGIGFIAHPDHEGTEMFHVKHFPWIDWTVSGYTGIGIWDFMTDWQATLHNYPKALMSYLFPALFLQGPRQVTLARWDRLNRDRRVPGIGELDNHDTPRTVWGVTLSVFPFRRAFRFIRTHVVLDSPFMRDTEKDMKTLLAALKGGRMYVAMEYFEEARGFSFSLFDDSSMATMGDELFLRGGASLRVEVPARGRIRVIKDGLLFREEESSFLECSVRERGVYRIEVYLKRLGRWRPWIFSNPVFVK